MSLHTQSHHLKLADDTATIIRSFTEARLPEHEGQMREEVFALIEFADRPAGAEELCEAVFATLRDLCFLDPTEDAFTRLETALKEVNAVIAEARDRLPNKHLGQIHAVIAFLSGKEIHLTQAGDGEAYLLRAGTFTTITEGLSPEGSMPDTFVNIASGEVAKGDKVICATERILRYATKNEVLRMCTPNKPIRLALEELDEVMVLEGAQRTGLLGVDVVSEQVAARAGKGVLPVELPGKAGEYAAKAYDGALRFVAGVRDRLPEMREVQLPNQAKLPVDKNQVVLGLLVVLLLAVVSLTWHFSGAGGASRAEVEQALLTANQHMDAGKMRANIGDKATATVELNEAVRILNELITAKSGTEQAEKLLAEVKLVQDQVGNVRRYETKESMVSFGDTANMLGVTDMKGRRVAFDALGAYEIVGGKVERSVTLEEAGTVRKGNFFAERGAIAFYTEGGGITEYLDGAVTVEKTQDAAWKTGVDIATYSSFLYVLDPVNSQIWRYSRKADGYSAASAWSKNADLSKAVSLAIDGDVWVLAPDGDASQDNDILRLKKGEKQAMKIRDLPEGIFTGPTKLFTTEDHRNVYVLDPAGRKVVRLYKDPQDITADNRQLVYNGQYLFENLSDLRDVYVDTAEQKMTVLDGKNLYEVQM